LGPELNDKRKKQLAFRSAFDVGNPICEKREKKLFVKQSDK
jgi:hypothetical protein